MACRARRDTIGASRFRLPGPTLEFEQLAWRMGAISVAGVDEAGRGAWAGPLVAAAVEVPYSESDCLRLGHLLAESGVMVNDSKQLRPAERELVLELAERQLRVTIVAIPAAEIDFLGLGRANQRALQLAAEALEPGPDHVLIDHFRLPALSTPAMSITKGDQRSVAIALSSIAAKVHRDQLMRELEIRFPGYGFGQHKGYGTRQHAEAIERLGVTDQHRRCFRPIQQALNRG